jgi:VWFA-related protein
MKQKLLFLTILGLVGLSFFLAAVHPSQMRAQTQTEPKQGSDATIRVEVNLVNLALTVRSVDGGFVKDMKKEDFQVYEDGVRQEITNFLQESVPVHVVLLIDISGSVRYEWGSIKQAARRFASELGPSDQVSVIVFNNQARLIQDWTNKLEKIERSLGKIFPKGETALFDALYVTFDDMLKNVRGKKAVILLTDGFDNISKVSYQTAVDLAVHSEALVYCVSEVEALRNSIEYAEREAGRKFGIRHEEYYNADMLLKKLSYETGGKVLYPDSFGELGNAYAKVAEELKNQYSIGYVPSNTLKDGSYRKIKVEVGRPGVRVSTRPGYFAPKGLRP